MTQLVETVDRRTAWKFLQHMLEAVPYQVHTILTDNGIQFAEQPRNRNDLFPADALRHDLRSERHQAQADQAEPPLDERSGRADEPPHQGRDGQTLPLLQP